MCVCVCVCVCVCACVRVRACACVGACVSVRVRVASTIFLDFFWADVALFTKEKSMKKTRSSLEELCEKSSKKWSGRVPSVPKFIEKAVREGAGAPRGLPLKKRIPALSFFSTSEAPWERFLDPGRDPKMAQNRALERKVALRDVFFVDFCRF